MHIYGAAAAPAQLTAGTHRAPLSLSLSLSLSLTLTLTLASTLSLTLALTLTRCCCPVAFRASPLPSRCFQKVARIASP